MMTDKRRVAIITGNSNSGRACIKELYDKYADKVIVRAAFRSEEKAKSFRDSYPDLEVVIGVDAYKPETLDPVFQNCEAALIVTPYDSTRGFSDDAALNENMINSAVSNGVKYIVFVGSWTVKDSNKIKIISSRFITAEHLLEKLGKEKNLKWTVLRGGFFMENTLYMFKETVKNEKALKIPEAYLPMVDTRDIGRSAAVCLVSDYETHHGKHYEMNGPELLSGEDIARAFSNVLGHEIKCIKLPKEAVKNMPEYIAQVWNYCLDIGKDAVPFTNDVKNLIGQNTTFEQFIRDHIQIFI